MVGWGLRHLGAWWVGVCASGVGSETSGGLEPWSLGNLGSEASGGLVGWGLRRLCWGLRRLLGSVGASLSLCLHSLPPSSLSSSSLHLLLNSPPSPSPLFLLPFLSFLPSFPLSSLRTSLTPSSLPLPPSSFPPLPRCPRLKLSEQPFLYPLSLSQCRRRTRVRRKNSRSLRRRLGYHFVNRKGC